MKRAGWLISKYLVQAVVPYFAFSWLLLSVILFVQQASRFSDIFFSINIPSNLIWQLSAALIPNVIAFTCPMAILVGTIIGLSKLQEDSELVAIRAAGVGDIQIAIPIVIVGILLSAFALLVNVKGVPLAARLVRNVAVQTAIKKLESPIEPGVFNTEIAGYTIYVKGGDIESGRWKNVFIYSEDAANPVVRLITSQRGRIDTTDEMSELVLENASISTIPRDPGIGKYVTENVDEVRLAIKTKRAELLETLGKQQGTAEELGIAELSDYAKTKDGAEKIEAEILLQRRLLLSISPLIFCLLGTAMILRFNRGGRGFAAFMALVSLVAYYLVTFLGEQLARTGKISVYLGGAIPIVVSLGAVLWLMFSNRLRAINALGNVFTGFSKRASANDSGGRARRNVFVDLTTGLRDFDLTANLFRYFLLSLAFLMAVFLIFTAFELWRFAGVMDGGTWLLTEYLTFLLPFVYLQIAPSAAMIATIATYVIKTRQNEIVTWTSAGQSVYRLMLPCFLLMMVLGGLNFGVQELIAPKTNPVQDELRNEIRKGGVTANASGKYWVANDRRIYSFEMDAPPGQNNVHNSLASDNESRLACPSVCVRDLTVYEFASDNNGLQALYRGRQAQWADDRIIFSGPVEHSVLREGRISTETVNGGELAEPENPFNELGGKPSHMSIPELRREIASSESDAARRNFAVALEKRFSTLFLPLVIALFTAPFALSLHRSGRVVTVGYAIGLWLVYTGITYLLEEFGLNGFLSPTIAVYSPLAIFTMLGVFLLSKVRT
jgi:lipopolysaccharide export LptBFGC system permease protein LptF